MHEVITTITATLQVMSWLEVVAVLAGIAYVYFAAKENILCWYAAFVGTSISIFLFWNVSLLMESALNVYYLLMAVFGWWQWQYGSQQHGSLSISSWSWPKHLITFISIILLTLVSGTLLAKNTDAALPYVDSFTTWASVITTWMVTRKILENWLYWVVIDAVSIMLYVERGLYLYAVLSAAYTVIAVFGFINWRKRIRQPSSA